MAHYGLFKSKTELVDLGLNPVVMFIAWRPKAMDMNGEKPVSFFNPKTPTFDKVKTIAKSGVQDNGCMFGPEYLIWIPGHGYSTLFLGSVTNRNASPAFQAMMPGPDGVFRCGVLGNQFIKNEEKKYSWHGMTVNPSSQSIDGPPLESIEPAASQFLNPQDSVIEEAAPAGAQENMQR